MGFQIKILRTACVCPGLYLYKPIAAAGHMTRRACASLCIFEYIAYFAGGCYVVSRLHLGVVGTHRAHVMACAVVSMPAMKKMLSSLHMRVKGSGSRSRWCRCIR